MKKQYNTPEWQRVDFIARTAMCNEILGISIPTDELPVEPGEGGQDNETGEF